LTTRRRSSRESWAAVSATVTGEPSRDTVVALGPQQEEAETVMAAVVSASSALVPTAGDRAAVADVADDDAPPPGGANGETGWHQPLSLHHRYW
jgi:hypothetical protein